ncbi:hypothetical protein O181_028698 [Austropuccinia psidii MF-1]|uniref:Uncharacterized protein n=1 Tax=Austropuccinia psidii MF-1 TaxID=1389203 RepID=A0A9Q3CUB9_9BASI|nr:hypothetical protein [Austropuccinia psidii MF-1]
MCCLNRCFDSHSWLNLRDNSFCWSPSKASFQALGPDSTQQLHLLPLKIGGRWLMHIDLEDAYDHFLVVIDFSRRQPWAGDKSPTRTPTRTEINHQESIHIAKE